ncbi:MAG TPA: adenylate/guanylate cyclase domain-containing protein [Polyangiaceae bacterium]
MRAIVVTRSVDMASPPERVWPFLADTERFNRLIGSHDVTYRPIEEGSSSSARFVAETRAGGFKLVYEEFPFEWSHQRTFGVHRRMRGGPVASYTWRCSLKRSSASDGEGALEGGTRATVRMEITPRHALFAPIAWINAKLFTAKFVGLGAMVDAHVVEGAASPYVKPASPADAAAVATAIGRLRTEGVDAALADQMGALVLEGADADVVRIRPFAAADEWKRDRREVLRAFLLAVPAGLVELRWGIVCPSCMTASQQARGLEDIKPEGHCQLCDITFDLDLDRAVEATFLPHPSVRRVPEALFCIGGPGRTPHVLVQGTVEAGATRDLDVPQEAGRYRLFARGGASATLEVDASGEAVVSATVDEKAVHPARLHASPGGTVRLTSQYPEARHVKIERLEFASAAATAHTVTTLTEFRTIFSSELLKRGTPLKVARAAVLFSDLTGSTALYSQVGDAAAFRLVDDHFDVLRAVVDAHDGVFVKTMGDAVMAAFVDASQCARAAIDALQRFEAFRAKEKHGGLVGLKLGLFAGACYVVTANGALDYFGQTVNVASRVQHLASSGEILMPVEVLESLPAVDRARLVERERIRAHVKGYEGELHLVRAGLRSASATTVEQPVAAPS